MRGVYVASLSRYATFWREFRDERGYHIVSSWIDAPELAPDDYPAFWKQALDEVATVDYLVAVHEKGDVWKGAFVEIGAMLAKGGNVLLVGDPPGSWVHHPNVTRHASLTEAMEATR